MNSNYNGAIRNALEFAVFGVVLKFIFVDLGVVPSDELTFSKLFEGFLTDVGSWMVFVIVVEIGFDAYGSLRDRWSRG